MPLPSPCISIKCHHHHPCCCRCCPAIAAVGPLLLAAVTITSKQLVNKEKIKIKHTAQHTFAALLLSPPLSLLLPLLSLLLCHVCGAAAVAIASKQLVKEEKIKIKCTASTHSLPCCHHYHCPCCSCHCHCCCCCCYCCYWVLLPSLVSN